MNTEYRCWNSVYWCYVELFQVWQVMSKEQKMSQTVFSQWLKILTDDVVCYCCYMLMTLVNICYDYCIVCWTSVNVIRLFTLSFYCLLRVCAKWLL